MHPFALYAALRGRVRALFRRDQVERELDEEVRFHLEMETEKNLRAGMSADEARRAALRAFGNVERMRDAHRDARGTRVVEEALADGRYAARALGRTPGFVAVSVLTLAVAIAIGTSLFTGVNGFVYRPLPVPGGGELLALFTSNYSGREARGGSSYLDLVSFSQSAGDLAELAGEARVTLGVGVGDGVTLVPGALVTSAYFGTLRLRPALGRFPDGARADEPAIVLSHALWRRAFASDTSVVGRQVKVNGHFFTVAAVTPREFLGTNRELAAELWVDAQFGPLLLPRDNLLNGRGHRSFRLIGRLRDGASADELRTRLGMLAARLAAAEPEAWRDSTGRARRVTVMRERDVLAASVPPGDLLLMVGGIAALGLALLAVACTNLASMQMARAAARRREIATRLALGAGRGRLVRQLLAESALIALPGALLGLALTAAVSSAAARYRPSGLPIVDLTLDARVLLYVAGSLLLTLLVFGLMPAMQSVRGDLTTELKGGAQPGGGRRGVRVGGVRGGLIVAQVALSVTFTAGSALVAFALARHARESLVDGDRVLVAPLTLLPAAGDSVRVAALVRELVDALGRVPGVEAVSATRFVPAPGQRMTFRVDLRDAGGPAPSRIVEGNLVRPGYFGVTGVPLLRGRDFDERDMSGSVRVAIVSGAMARRLWPGADALGRRLLVDSSGPPVEVVGVVGELRAAAGRPDEPSAGGMVYLPLRPEPEGELALHVRAIGPAAAIASRVADELRRTNTRAVASEVVPLDRYLERAVMPERITARVAALLAALQLALAVAGLSGLVAYVAALSRREIGIRSALGAGRARILGVVLRQAVRLTAVGGAVGVLLSLGLGRVIAATLPMTVAIELRALTVAVVGLALVAGAAMLLPARRALAVLPATTLRAE